MGAENDWEFLSFVSSISFSKSNFWGPVRVSFFFLGTRNSDCNWKTGMFRTQPFEDSASIAKCVWRSGTKNYSGDSWWPPWCCDPGVLVDLLTCGGGVPGVLVDLLTCSGGVPGVGGTRVGRGRVAATSVQHPVERAPSCNKQHTCTPTRKIQTVIIATTCFKICGFQFLVF